MTTNQNGWRAGIAAAAAGAAVFIAHNAGLFADDAARVAPRVGRVGVPAGQITDVLSDPSVSSSLKQAVSTFRDLQKGTPEETVVARAGCSVMSASTAEASARSSYDGRIRALLPPAYVQGPQSAAVNRYVARAATALTVADANGGAARLYAQYCLFKP